MNRTVSRAKEALLLLDFTPDELEHLTPGELHLLAALDDDMLPDILVTPETEHVQQVYAGRVIAHLTEMILRSDLPNCRLKQPPGTLEHSDTADTHMGRLAPLPFQASAIVPYLRTRNTSDDK